MRKILLTRQEAADALGLSLDSFERHVQPHLSFVVIGRRKQIPLAEVERWLETQVSRVPKDA